MLQWPRLVILLLLSAAACGTELKCDKVNYYNYCWNSTIHQRNPCWRCVIENQEISEPDQVIFISPKFANGTIADVELVQFYGGVVNIMPKIIHKTNNKQILQVQLLATNTQVLNAQFFGSSGENLKYFFSFGNSNSSIEAFAFQNCTNLEYLGLYNSEITSIPSDAFRGLYQLIILNLDWNQLSLVDKSWFYDLASLEVLHLFRNQLEEIPENTFNSLTKLKRLDLDENKIEIITQKMFQNNVQLKEIYLTSNRINQIQSGSFAHLSQLTELNLNENKCINITFVNKTSQEIAEGLSSCYPKTKSSCVIPQISNGFIVSIVDNSSQISGELFEVTSSVKVVCNSTFTQIHDKANQTTNRCVKDDWEDQQWPTCHRLCSHEEIIDPSFSALCDRDGEDFPCSGHLLPGTTAIIRCQTGFMNPKGLVNSKLTCQESGKWNQSAHKCEQISENISEPSSVQSGVSCRLEEISQLSILTHCDRDGDDFPCTDHLPPGTTATIRCHFGYKKPPKVKSVLTCEESGNWSLPAYKCEPICGKVPDHSVPLQIGGKDTNVTEVPWHVGIHKNGEQICGGTIISERVVISAAHCFSQNTDGMHDIDYKSFKVAAGKIVRGLYANESQAAQIRDVLKVEISQQYDGSNTWWADIAAIIIDGHFNYKQHIVPACVNFSKNRDDWYPKNESRALVAGWGLNKDGNSSDILQSFDIPVLDFDTCQENAPQVFETKVVDDKICAGYVNSNENLSKVVCMGDSGGGLLIPMTVGGEKRYFLQGVVSNSQQTLDCDKTYYTLFTNVQYYKNPIMKALKFSLANGKI